MKRIDAGLEKPRAMTPLPNKDVVCAAEAPVMRCFAAAYYSLEAGRNNLYSIDGARLAALLARFLSGKHPSYYAIDIGANVGQTAAAFIDAFTTRSCKVLKSTPASDCSMGLHPVNPIVSVEPFPENFRLLAAEGQRFLWDQVGWRALHLAVSDVPTKAATIFGNPGEGNQQASLSAPASRAESESYASTVEVVTVEGLLDASVDGWRSDGRLCFLLKIDAEGMDPAIITGAAPVLRDHRVKFLVFEYGDKWVNVGRDFTLRRTVDELAGLNYTCALATHQLLLPLTSPAAWHVGFEKLNLCNVLCGRREDDDWRGLLRGAGYARSHEIAADADALRQFQSDCQADAIAAAVAPGDALATTSGIPSLSVAAAAQDFVAHWARFLECVG